MALAWVDDSDGCLKNLCWKMGKAILLNHHLRNGHGPSGFIQINDDGKLGASEMRQPTAFPKNAGVTCDRIRINPPWLGCWRDRLALSLVALAAREIGRTEEEAAIRDAVFLTSGADYVMLARVQQFADDRYIALSDIDRRRRLGPGFVPEIERQGAGRNLEAGPKRHSEAR